MKLLTFYWRSFDQRRLVLHNMREAAGLEQRLEGNSGSRICIFWALFGGGGSRAAARELLPLIGLVIDSVPSHVDVFDVCLLRIQFSRITVDGVCVCRIPVHFITPPNNHLPLAVALEIIYEW
ncbi:F-box protein at3g54460 [Phtheirospermum japonicum]|uniref:F-box protein at3g54460 n=1 Tax=Phtheirospermum japonicum TaxID=374723 RepID=A0A830C066_9LAMI|nr:F-box protein at3g54460 [Phtheirospermum japonicum]